MGTARVYRAQLDALGYDLQLHDPVRRVLRSYYAISGLWTLSASVIWGVNTLFLLDAGLSIGEVFTANAAFSAGMVLFEIPTGVVADTLGRRVSYLLSVAVLAATTLAYLAAADAQAGVLVFVAISLVMGLGFTFYSGALEAWLVDALHSVDAEEELDPETMDVFPNVGKRERRIGPAASDTEI